ncbi:MAG: hypothetical protein ACI90V_010776, partial [Bacillariaceae sp.]
KTKFDVCLYVNQYDVTQTTSNDALYSDETM